MAMSTRSVAARSVPGLWRTAVHEECSAEPGDFEILESPSSGPKSLAMCCPGCGSVSLLNLRPGNGPSWTFDGNRERPTLHPSIHHLKCWHGWLYAGQFISC